MMSVTVHYLLIITIEFCLSFHTLWICMTLFCIIPLLSLIPHFFLYRSLSSLQLQLSHVATLVALSMAAPQAMASTTMTWCASRATKATPWKDPPRPNARPTASGASSHQCAKVRSSGWTPAGWMNDWHLDWLAASEGWKCVLTVELKCCLLLTAHLAKVQMADIPSGGQRQMGGGEQEFGTSRWKPFTCIWNDNLWRGYLFVYQYNSHSKILKPFLFRESDCHQRDR